MTPAEIAALIGRLPAVDSEPPADAREEDMDPYRRRIDAIDGVILALLNARADCANAIGHIKKQLGLPVYVPSREVEVLDNVMSRNPGPLPDRAVRHLFERIIDETRSLERHLYQDESDDDAGRTRA